MAARRPRAPLRRAVGSPRRTTWRPRCRAAAARQQRADEGAFAGSTPASGSSTSRRHEGEVVDVLDLHRRRRESSTSAGVKTNCLTAASAASSKPSPTGATTLTASATRPSAPMVIMHLHGAVRPALRRSGGVIGRDEADQLGRLGQHRNVDPAVHLDPAHERPQRTLAPARSPGKNSRERRKERLTVFGDERLVAHNDLALRGATLTGSHGGGRHR